MNDNEIAALENLIAYIKDPKNAGSVNVYHAFTLAELAGRAVADLKELASMGLRA